MNKKIITGVVLIFALSISIFASGAETAVGKQSNYDDVEFAKLKTVMEKLVKGYEGSTSQFAITGFDLSKAYKAEYIDVDTWSGEQQDLDLFAKSDKARWFVATTTYGDAQAVSEVVAENGNPRWVGMTFMENNTSFEQFPDKGMLVQKLKKNNYQVDKLSYFYTTGPMMTGVAIKVENQEYVLISDAPPFHGFERGKFYTMETFASTLKKWQRNLNETVPLGGGGDSVNLDPVESVKLISDEKNPYESPYVMAATCFVLVAVLLGIGYGSCIKKKEKNK